MGRSNAARRRPRAPRPSRRGLRTCVGCREGHPREALVRLVCSPEGRVLVDRYLRAPGRGAHLCYSRACVEQAVRRRAFGRAFRQAVQPIEVDALAAEIEEAIDARIRDALALGRRAGRTLSGTDVLERRADRVLLLVLAEDAAEATADRLTRKMAALGRPVHRFGDAAGLGATQGKERRVAVGVTHPELTTRLAIEFERRDRFGLRPEAKSR